MKIKNLLLMFVVFTSCIIVPEEALHPFEEMHQGTQEDEQFKRYFFSAKNNIFCKKYDRENNTFSSSLCDYSIEKAYAYFIGQKNHSLIPELVFESKQELQKWAQQQENSYLIAYKPGCIPCANLLAAIETRMQNLQADGKSVFMVNVHKNKEAFNEDRDCWYYQGTPEIWHLKNGVAQKILISCPAHHYFEEFIASKNL